MVAQQMELNLLRTTSGPFDWFISSDLSAITNNFKNKFSELFVPQNMILDLKQLSLVYNYYTDNYSKFRSLHDVSKISKNEAHDLIALKLKFSRRVERFFMNIHRSENTLLIRGMSNDDDLHELDKCLFDIWGDKHVLLGVTHAEISEVAVNKVDERIFVANMNCTNESINQQIRWIGNVSNWKQLLFNINAPKSKKYFSKIQIIEMNKKNRQIVIWGAGIGLILVTNSLNLDNYLLYDSNKQNIENTDQDRIVDDFAMLNTRNNYIIVS